MLNSWCNWVCFFIFNPITLSVHIEYYSAKVSCREWCPCGIAAVFAFSPSCCMFVSPIDRVYLIIQIYSVTSEVLRRIALGIGLLLDCSSHSMHCLCEIWYYIRFDEWIALLNSCSEGTTSFLLDVITPMSIFNMIIRICNKMIYGILELLLQFHFRLHVHIVKCYFYIW